MDRATEVLFEGLEKNVYGRDAVANVAGGEAEGNVVGVEVERIRLAGLLPGLARWSQLALNGLPNELVDVRLPFVFVLVFVLFWGVSDYTFAENLELAGGIVYFGHCVWAVRGEVPVMMYISSIEMYTSYPYIILFKLLHFRLASSWFRFLGSSSNRSIQERHKLPVEKLKPKPFRLGHLMSFWRVCHFGLMRRSNCYDTS